MLAHGYQRNNILNIYLCGSRLYGNITDKSDHDYTVIVTNYINNDPNIRTNIDITILTVDDMNTSLQNHDIQRLINILSDSVIIQNIEFSIVINKQLLRSKISEISNKCLHHAKTSWKEGDIYKSKKHFIHSIRYVEFGIQILLYNKIINLSICNDAFNNIMNDTNTDYQHYYSIYQPIAKDLYKNKFLPLL